MSTLNTGFKAYLKLVKVTDDGTERPLDSNNKLVSITGLPQDTKNNVVGDVDYIEPVLDVISCPIPNNP